MSSQSTQGLDAGAQQDRDTALSWIIMIVLVLAGLLALGLLVAFVYALYLLVTQAAPEVVAAVVVASGTLLVAGLTYYSSRQQERISRQQERISALEQQQREQRVSIYQEFVS